MEKAFAIPISRRDFMKLAGLTVAPSLLGIKDDAVKAEATSPAISALDYGVCRTAYPIDIHDVKLDYFEKLKKGQYYEIPYRTLVTNEISNLLVAGRCASGSFAAQASFRIQPTCMSIGEAAGIAIACGISHGIEANALRPSVNLS